MVMEMERSFEVNTPLGKLKVYAKQEDDVPENFPGVYIDLIPADSNDTILRGEILQLVLENLTREGQAGNEDQRFTFAFFQDM